MGNTETENAEPDDPADPEHWLEGQQEWQRQRLHTLRVKECPTASTGTSLDLASVSNRKIAWFLNANCRFSATGNAGVSPALEAVKGGMCVEHCDPVDVDF